MKQFAYGTLWVAITVALCAAGITSMAFLPDSNWESDTNISIFWISLSTALVGLVLQARHDFSAFCFGTFFYAFITAIITAAVALRGEEPHPVAASVAVVTTLVTVLCAVYLVRGPNAGGSTATFDKAEYHFDSVSDAGLPPSSAYVHGGLLLAWLIEHDLQSDGFDLEYGEAVTAIRSGERTGPQVFEDDCSGVLDEELLSDEANAFLQWYLNDETTASFWKDYQDVLTRELPSFFHVEDNRENYDLLAKRLSARYAEWQAKRAT